MQPLTGHRQTMRTSARVVLLEIYAKLLELEAQQSSAIVEMD